MRQSAPAYWESMTPVYTRWITNERYLKLRPAYQKWYRPACPVCRDSGSHPEGENAEGG